MTTKEIQQKLDELIPMVENGKALEAFDRLYHDDLVAQENLSEPRTGKLANRKFEENFLNNITAIRKYNAVSTMVGTNVSVIAWEIDIDHADWGLVQMTEINLQTWEDGKIIRETYNYNS
ncbi:MAG: nuclear transport factor 2 family protein [Bacteroidota bacterium]